MMSRGSQVSRDEGWPSRTKRAASMLKPHSASKRRASRIEPARFSGDAGEEGVPRRPRSSRREASRTLWSSRSTAGMRCPEGSRRSPRHSCSSEPPALFRLIRSCCRRFHQPGRPLKSRLCRRTSRSHRRWAMSRPRRPRGSTRNLMAYPTRRFRRSCSPRSLRRLTTADRRSSYQDSHRWARPARPQPSSTSKRASGPAQTLCPPSIR
jgi:hypothetical protein